MWNKYSNRETKYRLDNQRGAGCSDEDTFRAIDRFAQTEGLVSDPVYEGKAIRGLLELAQQGRFEADSRVLLMHLGGTIGIHAYASQFGPINLSKFVG